VHASKLMLSWRLKLLACSGAEAFSFAVSAGRSLPVPMAYAMAEEERLRKQRERRERYERVCERNRLERERKQRESVRAATLERERVAQATAELRFIGELQRSAAYEGVRVRVFDSEDAVDSEDAEDAGNDPDRGWSGGAANNGGGTTTTIGALTRLAAAAPGSPVRAASPLSFREWTERNERTAGLNLIVVRAF
jgi:hypothetical protein